MIELWVATTNQGKLREIQRILEAHAIIKSTKDLPVYSAPPENGATFVDNARIKAKSVRSIKNDCWVLGEDSGIEVEGLGGLPGVHSARYAGDNAKDAENYLKVLKMLQIRGIANRAARLKCALVLYSPDGTESVFDGQLDGTISREPRGHDGFGYDPIFIPNGETQTLAELGLAAKNKLSHRAIAVAKMLEVFK